jgi:hypothetical protein
MIKLYCTLFTLCFGGLYSQASTVTVDAAQLVAQHFYQSTAHSSGTATFRALQSEADGSIDLYVFNIQPRGFVVVSATDNVAPILAYSTEGNFSGIARPGMMDWMQHIAANIHQAAVLQAPAPAAISELWSAYALGRSPKSLNSNVVSPMLSTTWGQSPYYNAMCPYDSARNARCVTGCEATAMAQIMRFWSYPAQGTGSFSYIDAPSNTGYYTNIGTVSADFGATVYKWSEMPGALTADNGNIATVMYQCGVAMGMNYGSGGSAAYTDYPGHPCAMNAFTSYFAYDAQTIKYVDKANYTDASWQAMIVSELNAGRPVLYSGQDTGNIGGHAWVCDGYDASGMLHMNWGWGGMDNGYFSSTDLNPGTENWSWGQVAIIGIQPPATALTSVAAISETADYSLYPNPANRSITIKGNTANLSAYTIYDAIGNKIAAGTLAENASTVDVSNFITGLYFVKLENGQQESVLRFVVDK